jgi:hypothetical protein
VKTSIRSSLTLTSPSLPQATPRVARFEVTTGVGLAPVSPTTSRFRLKPNRDLNRWLPLVKWFLATPHYVVLVFLMIGAVFAIVIAWLAILITGRYPQPLFNYVVGIGRWR